MKRLRMLCVLFGTLLPILSLLQVPALADTVYQLSGKISDTAGHGLAGVSVDAVSTADSNTSFSATSADSGDYLLQLPAGMYTVGFTPAAGSGYQQSTVQLTVSSDQVYDLALAPTQPPPPVTRRVQAYYGPGEQADFSLSPLGGGSVLSSIAVGGWLVSPGKYQLKNVVAGQVSLPDFQPVVDTTTSDVIVRLTLQTSFMPVVLLDPQGNAVFNPTFSTDPGSGTTAVTVDTGSGPTTIVTSATDRGATTTSGSGATGLQLVNGVAHSQVCGSASGYNLTCTAVSFTAGSQTTSVTLVATPVTPVFSRVTLYLDAGLGPDQSEATVTSATTGTSYPVNFGDGRYHVPFGSYQVTDLASSTMSISGTSPVFNATTADTSLTATLGTAPLSVTVRDQNGNLVPAVTVSTDAGTGLAPVHYVAPGLNTTVASPVQGIRNATFSTGSGAISLISQLTYLRLCASAATVTNQCTAVSIVGGVTDSIVLTVQSSAPPPPARTISVYTTDGQSTQLSNATAVATDGSGRTYQSLVSDGKLHVPAGIYRITEVVESFSNAGATFTPGNTGPIIDTTGGNGSLTISYQPAAVDVQILDAQGRPIPGATWSVDVGSGQTVLTYHPDTAGATTAAVPASTNGPPIVGLSYHRVCAKAPTMPLTCQFINFVAGDPNLHVIFRQQPPAPGIPQDVRAPAATSQLPVIDWTATAGADHYAIYRDGKQIGITATTEYQDTTVSADGTYSYTVTAVATGGQESAQSSAAKVQYDTTPPTLSELAAAAASSAQPVQVTGLVTDALSGVAQLSYYVDDDPGPGRGSVVPAAAGRFTLTIGVLPIGPHQIGIRAQDAAGNWSDASTVTVELQLPAPYGLTATSPTTSVLLSWLGSTDDVGYRIYRDGQLAGTSSSTSFADPSAPEGHHEYTVSASDAVGHSSTLSAPLAVLVDRTAPTISYTASPSGNDAGWNNGAVTVTFTCSDDLSGMAFCAKPVVISADGVGQVVTGQAIDNAGNAASVTAVVNLDQSPPQIDYSLSPAPNDPGWNNRATVVTFSCSDSVSGIQSCPAPVTVTEQTSGPVVGTAIDRAGNTAAVTVPVKVDTDAPTITAIVSQAPTAAGWYGGPVTISFSCSDALSGVAVCSAPVTLTQQGSNQLVTGTATDLAGNLASTTLSVSIDLTAPTIVATRTAANGAGWNAGPVAISFVCTDDLSGIADCQAPVQLITDGRNQSVTGKAVDRAGNQATALVSNINIDQTAPVVTVLGPTDGATYELGSQPQPACSTSDALSGVYSNAVPTLSQQSGGRFTATCAGAIDNAGNSATAAIHYTVTATSATLQTLTDGFLATSNAPDSNGAQHSLDAKLAAGNVCAYIAEVNRQSTGPHPTLTGQQATQLIYWARTINPNC